MWSRIYCCCAVPLYNSGIYLILLQFLIISLVSGILTFAAPTVLAVALPSWCHIVFGGACLVVSGVQVLGFFGVYREKPDLFKNYSRINTIIVSITFLLAAAFIGLSASHHSTAVTKCEASFSEQVNNSTAQVETGSTICNIWTWVQVGVMGFLWGILVLSEAYFLMYQSIYASEQKLDHARYESVVNEAAEEIRQSGLWDRPSADFLNASAGGHGRNLSKSSGLRNEILPGNNNGYEETDGGYSNVPRMGSAYDIYGASGAAPSTSGGGGRGGQPYYPDQAHEAYSYPTPIDNQHYQPQQYSSVGGYGGKEEVGYPDQVRTGHPLEGSRGRKTPKLGSETGVTGTGGMGWDDKGGYR